jgi:transcriptional regulator with XRE-family HTH domain
MKRRRKYLGISQMELAMRTNLSSGYIGELENGGKFPSAEKLEILADALRVRPFILLMSDEDLSLETREQSFLEETGRLKSIMDRGFGELMERMRPQSEGKNGPYG